MQLMCVREAQAGRKIDDGDLLLFRRWGLISICGRGPYSHAAMAAWGPAGLMCLEVREFCGGRAVMLESQVRAYPKCIDVFEANPNNRWPEYDRASAVERMWRKCGKQYNYRGVIGCGLLHVPIARVLARVPCEEKQASSVTDPEFCSQACADADHWGGGVDPVPHLAACRTEPSDLGRSPFYEYKFTLTCGHIL